MNSTCNVKCSQSSLTNHHYSQHEFTCCWHHFLLVSKDADRWRERLETTVYETVVWCSTPHVNVPCGMNSTNFFYSVPHKTIYQKTFWWKMMDTHKPHSNEASLPSVSLTLTQPLSVKTFSRPVFTSVPERSQIFRLSHSISVKPNGWRCACVYACGCVCMSAWMCVYMCVHVCVCTFEMSTSPMYQCLLFPDLLDSEPWNTSLFPMPQIKLKSINSSSIKS